MGKNDLHNKTHAGAQYISCGKNIGKYCNQRDRSRKHVVTTGQRPVF